LDVGGQVNDMARKSTLTSVASFALLAASGCQNSPTHEHAPSASAVSELKTGHVEFTDASFASAQKAGKPIVVEVWASWCPTCKAQQKGIAAALADPANKELVVMRINYDKQKAEQKQFRITRQSTLIAYKGMKETGRLVAITDPAQIAQLFAKTR
jgi:thiol-disulfide isomerase/thioredoxin